MRLRDAAGAEYYMKQAREHGLGVGFVSVREREDVVDWLEPWKADTALFVRIVGYVVEVGFSGSSGRQRHLVLLTANSWAESTPRTRVVEALTTTPLKRRYVADVHGVEVVNKIKQNSVELRDWNTVLCGAKANVRKDLTLGSSN